MLVFAVRILDGHRVNKHMAATLQFNFQIVASEMDESARCTFTTLWVLLMFLVIITGIPTYRVCADGGVVSMVT